MPGMVLRLVGAWRTHGAFERAAGGKSSAALIFALSGRMAGAGGYLDAKGQGKLVCRDILDFWEF